MNNRVPYWDDLRWDEDGEQLYDGTCLLVDDHQVELYGWEQGTYRCRVICPDADEGGCVITNAGDRQECWMIPWMDNIGPELVDGGDVTVRFSIKDTSQDHMLSDEEGFTIELMAVIGDDHGS
jgi:hypothetical protein